MLRPLFSLALAAAIAAPAMAQDSAQTALPKRPVHQLGPIVATSTEPVGDGVIVRGLSGGRSIVNAGTRQKVFAFDSTLKQFTIAIDSGVGLGNAPLRASGLIPYFGDSTLFVDIGSTSFLVFDAKGAVARVIAAPRAQDLIYLSIPAAFGRPAFDSKGRLVYKSFLQKPPQPSQTADGGNEIKSTAISADSAPIVRGDLDARTIDTVAWVSAPSQGRYEMKQKPNGGAMVFTITVNPFPVADEWAMLTDGSIAIVRAHDYHIDWVYPDGTKLSAPKMPYNWQRYGDGERQRYADSIRTLADSQIKVQQKAQAGSLPPGAPKTEMSIDIVPEKEWPDYYAPVKSGSVIADLDDHLWILPTSSSDVKNGFTYDIVNRTGEVIDRIQVPLGRVVAGFGPGGMVYLAHHDGKTTFLERALIHAPGTPVHSQ